MVRIFITVIVLYLVFLACYTVWERRVKRRRNAARKRGKPLFSSPPPEDIIGKSQFDLRHSRPQATTLIQSEKRDQNDSTFADGYATAESQSPPAAVPDERLDRAFSSGDDTDNSGDVNITIDNEPEGEESDSYEENIDTDESEDEDDVPTGAAMATGISFDELSGMVRTVNDPDAATGRDREDAGRVLVEVRQTDMFEQVVSGQPEKKTTANRLMDDHFAEWNRRKREAGELNDEPTVKAPDNFDARAFARQ